jgi:TctA family transporter
MTTMASFAGGTFGILLLMLFTPIIAHYALALGAAEYFALMVFGLVAASTISDGSAVKGLAMVLVGLLMGTVGTDIYTGVTRFAFGRVELFDSLSLTALAMGMFGVSEIILSVRSDGSMPAPQRIKLADMKPTADDVRRSWFPVLRGSSIGSFFGTLPGVGTAVASFMAYAVEKRISSEPQRFGKGAIEGIMAPESADNAAEETSFIPTLALGIPGSPTMALMLGALIIHGIAPGPALINEHPTLFWGLIMSFWIGNILLVILNVPLIGVWVRMLSVPYHMLFPAVLAFVCIGSYSVNGSIFEVFLVAAFGLAGYVLKLLEFSAAPLLLGFVLGPLMEEHFRRGMILSRGNFATFVERPISAAILTLTALTLVWVAWSSLRRMNKLPRSLES